MSEAENALYHQSIMLVSYISYEHCFAVYSPFFLLMAGHVLAAHYKNGKDTSKRRQGRNKRA